MVKVPYFMGLAETVACIKKEISLMEEAGTLAGLLAMTVQRGEQSRLALGDAGNFQLSVNKKFVDSAPEIKEGDEIPCFRVER